MTNGFDTTQGLPSQGEGWWDRIKKTMEGTPIYPEEGKADYGMWGSILGRGAQAITAQDPQSWQYQMGGLGAEIGQAHKMAMTAEADRKRRDEFRKIILKSLGLDIPMPGEEEEEPPTEGSRLDRGTTWGDTRPGTLLDMYMGGS